MKRIVITFSFLFVLFSCSNQDDAPPIPVPPKPAYGVFTDAVYLPNEGNFGRSNASLSILFANDSLANNQYEAYNQEKLGDVFQSMTLGDSLAYLVVNNSNKIEVVQRNNMKRKATLTEGVIQPRYLALAKQKIFITNQGTYPEYDERSIAIFSAATHEALGIVPLPIVPEQIKTAQDDLYIVPTSYSGDNRIVRMDAEAGTLAQEIELSKGISSLVVTPEEDAVYVLASDEAEGSYIYEIDPQAHLVRQKWTLEGVTAPKKLAFDHQQLYFVDQNKVYRFRPERTLSSLEAILTLESASWSSFYGFNVIDGKMYISDANSFTQNGTVRIYSVETASLLKTATVGMGPNGFYH